MGRKRAYCPYCDVFLVHNSLKSRRDHAIGWKHRCNFQFYYNRYLGKAKLDDFDTNVEETRPSTSSSTINSIPSTSSTLFETQSAASSRPLAPPTLIGLSKKIAPPPTIKPPNFMSTGQSPLKPPSIQPPSFAPPSIKPLGISGPPPLGPPSIGQSPMLNSPLKPPTLGTPLKPPVLGPPLKPPVLGTPLKPPQLGPPSLNSPFKSPLQSQSSNQE